MKRLLWLVPALAAVLSGADISGQWTGVIEVTDTSSGSVIDTPVRAEFQQKSNAISGKIGRKEDEQTESIRNGRVEGDRFVFEVVSPETTGAIKFDLTVRGDHIEGMMKGAIDSGPITGKVNLKRAAAK